MTVEKQAPKQQERLQAMQLLAQKLGLRHKVLESGESGAAPSVAMYTTLWAPYGAIGMYVVGTCKVDAATNSITMQAGVRFQAGEHWLSEAPHLQNTDWSHLDTTMRGNLDAGLGAIVEEFAKRMAESRYVERLDNAYQSALHARDKAANHKHTLELRVDQQAHTLPSRYMGKILTLVDQIRREEAETEKSLRDTAKSLASELAAMWDEPMHYEPLLRANEAFLQDLEGAIHHWLGLTNGPPAPEAPPLIDNASRAIECEDFAIASICHIKRTLAADVPNYPQPPDTLLLTHQIMSAVFKALNAEQAQEHEADARDRSSSPRA